MNKMKIKFFLLAILIFICGESAQSAVVGDEAATISDEEFLDNLLTTYKNWGKAGWTAKVSVPKLPITVTLKVYMQKDELTLISVRAPFAGEVARVEVDKDSVLICNNYTKVYYSKPVNDIPVNIQRELQALLLGRVTVVNQGELNKKNIDKVCVFPSTTDGGRMLIPVVPVQFSGWLYGFQVDSKYKMTSFVVAYGREETEESVETDISQSSQMESGISVEEGNETEMTISESTFEPDVQFTADISRSPKDVATVEMELLKANDTPRRLKMTVDPIEWGCQGFSRIGSLEGYRKVGIKELMKLPF